MLDFIRLLNTYSLSDIVLFIILLASAIMGAGKFFEWSSSFLKKIFGKEFTEESKENALSARLKAIEEKASTQDQSLGKIADSMNFFSDKLDMLVDSDKDSIKAYLTDKHHYYVYTQKWIDDYNLDCIERRYGHYKKAGGNSFVDHLMDELRLLPTQQSFTGQGAKGEK